LNDSVWAPSFWLPKADFILTIMDLHSGVIKDRDLGEMFLNFELHPPTRKYIGVDVAHWSLVLRRNS